MHRVRSHHFYEGHEITDPVNVAHLRLGDQWYHLYFECATIFWAASGNPETPQNHDPACGLLLNDLSGIDGVVGHVKFASESTLWR